MKLTQNDLGHLAAVFEASGLLADIRARYANIKANYRDRDFEDSEQLDRTIIAVYVAILEYSAEVVLQSQRHFPRIKYCESETRTLTKFQLERFLESFNSLEEQPLHKLLENIEGKEKVWRDGESLLNISVNKTIQTNIAFAHTTQIGSKNSKRLM